MDQVHPVLSAVTTSEAEQVSPAELAGEKASLCNPNCEGVAAENVCQNSFVEF